MRRSSRLAVRPWTRGLGGGAPLALALMATAVGQGSAADYERALATPARLAGTVFRDRVEPRWLPGDRGFWYRIETSRGRHEFILVDCRAGTRTPAFDAAKVADALARDLGRAVAADRLPFERIRVSDDLSRVDFAAEGRAFTVDRATGDVRALDADATDGGPAGPETPPADRLRPRGRPPRSESGERTTLRVVNRLDRPVRLEWQPDGGESVLYARIVPDETAMQSTYVGHVWVIRDDDRRPLAYFQAEPDGVAVVDEDALATATAERARRPRRPDGPAAGPDEVSPDGRARIVAREDDLYLIETATGRSEPVTTDGGPGRSYGGPFRWSPDGRFVVAVRRKPGDGRTVTLVDSRPSDGVRPKTITIPYDKPGDALEEGRPCLIDVARRAVVPLDEDAYPRPWSIDRIEWWPDSSAFTFVYNERGHQRLAVLEASTDGTVRPLVDERSETFICYSQKFFYRRLDEPREILWASERDGWNHLYRFDGRTGELINQVTSGPWAVRDVEAVDEQARRITFSAGGLVPGESPYHRHRAEVGFDGSDLVRLTDGDGTHDWRDSPTGRYMLDRYSRVDLPPATVLRERATGRTVVELERADASALLATGWRMPERFVAPGRDGTTPIHGVIVRPSTFDPAEKYPVIEEIYAGPHGFSVPQAFETHVGKARLAELGFLVVQIDGMGTSGRSKAFHDVCYKNLGDAGLPDRVAWLRAAATAHPELDLTRVGIFGGSAGGQNALAALLHHGETYRVGVADCGCHDNRLDKVWWNEQWMGWPVDESYAASSNVTHAGKLTGRLLLIVGELDRNVDPASTMQVADALIEADKDFDLLVMPGVGHGALGHPYARRRMFDFFVRHLWHNEPRHDPSP